jgi:DNA polymerase-3 subunit gamma/tau
MLGIVGSDSMFRLVDAMIDGDIEASIQAIDEIILNGKDVLQFIKDLIKHFRNLLMVKVSKKPGDIIDVSEDTINRFKEQAKRLRSEEIMRGINIIIDAENDSKYTSQPRILLEMAAVKFCKKEYDSSLEMMLGRIKMLEEAVKSGAIAVSLDESKPKREAREVVSKPESSMLVKETRAQQMGSETVDKNAAPISIDEIKTCWQEVIGLIKSNKKVTVSAWLSLGVPVNIEGNNIIISFDHQHVFSKNNLENPPENKKIVEECFSRILNKPARVTFRVNEEQNTIDRDIERVRSIVGDDLIEVIE